MNVADYFRKNKMEWKPVVIESSAELNGAFFAGRCDVLTSDASQLAAIRSVAPNPDDYIILPEIISKEPLAPEMIKEVLDVMIELAQEGMTMIVVTHEMGFARSVAHRVLFMDFGKIVEGNTPEEFFANPVHERTKLYLSQILH